MDSYIRIASYFFCVRIGKKEKSAIIRYLQQTYKRPSNEYTAIEWCLLHSRNKYYDQEGLVWSAKRKGG